MDDLISRQAAIDAVGNMLRRKFGVGGDLAEITLAGVPSAQPYTEADIQKMQDLEQAQIEKAFELGREEGRKEAQPEIIRCKDCKYRDENWRRVAVRWMPCMDVRTGGDWFCGSAERREE